MTARILVVDDVAANIRLLNAKLTAEYYDVLVASDGPTALTIALAEQPDIVLLDVMMPGMDGYEVCRRLKDDPRMRHIPVVMVTALDGIEERVRGLEAGADEFLNKPIDDLFLFARVRSLTRLKTVTDELRQREASGRRMGLLGAAPARFSGGGGRVLIVDDEERQARAIERDLQADHRPVVELDPEKALLAARGPVDLVIINVTRGTFDGLRFAAQLRSHETTRHLPILGVVNADERPRLVKALEMGFNDLLTRPIDGQELLARVRSQIKTKRFADFLRHNLDDGMEMAVTDPLTGLHNRRHMLGQLSALVERSTSGAGVPVAALMIDVDHFKKVNDCFGHQVGDEVLREFAVRLATNVRASDIPCRFGGEEFMVIMPDTSLSEAKGIADRIRAQVAGSPFRVNGGTEPLTVTISIGVAATLGAGDTLETLLSRADAAAYQAKAGGRNMVVAKAA